MTTFETALNAFNHISAPAGFEATSGGTFVPVGDDFTALTGAGADWDISERSSLWSAVADVEADYRSLKIDGREG